MSGWFGIISIFITTIGGSLGVTYFNNRKEIVKMKLKMQDENDKKIEERLKAYVDYVEGKLKESNKRFDDLYGQYVELQSKALERESELQNERQKTINAVYELGVVKREYETLKTEFINEKRRLEDHNTELTNRCNVLSAQLAKLLERVKLLEKGQCEIVEELHPAEPTQP